MKINCDYLDLLAKFNIIINVLIGLIASMPAQLEQFQYWGNYFLGPAEIQVQQILGILEILLIGLHMYLILTILANGNQVWMLLG